MRDLTETPGNPAFELRQQYERLMAITDTATLVDEAKTIVTPMAGHGISDRNHRKFTFEIDHATERGLVSVQMYLSNYLLAASGNRTIDGRTAA